MKGKIAINPQTQLVWFPKQIIESGFTGDVEYLTNAATLVLLHPKASLEEIEASLKLLLEDIALGKKLTEKTVAIEAPKS